MKITKILGFLCVSALFFSCGTTANTTISKDDKSLNDTNVVQKYNGLKRTVAIARFSNETEYAKGAFYDKDNDPVGKQALDILSAKLAATGKFILLERSDADKIQAELEKSGSSASGAVADYLIVGSVTEFGRKTTGDVGLFTRSKKQTVEAGVNLRLVEVSSGQIIYSEQGKGSAETSSSTTLGMGGVQGYDATLSDKAISAAIEKLVENIEKTCMDRPWKSYFLSYDKDAVIIGGGAKQNLSAGKVLSVYERGKKVKNPQTGLTIELPGTKVAEVTVLSTGGTTVTDEYSIVKISNGVVDSSKLNNYVIQEK
ncbi:penicillin-binding protein activator LpoB [Treponema pectinovorum]|uniref:CsgG/HfaB family protein n=1 Tax=Treponema pectinovorum TaxID=164 RepID=UPI0011F1C681|nr:CsgG/HfaB family protein [Treponema pectinovorum]